MISLLLSALKAGTLMAFSMVIGVLAEALVNLTLVAVHASVIPPCNQGMIGTIVTVAVMVAAFMHRMET